MVKADGTGRRVLAEELTREKGSWTQFVGWSPDGKTAVFARGWKSDENGKWEEEHKTFRYPQGRLLVRRLPVRPGQRQGDERDRRRAGQPLQRVPAVSWPPATRRKLSFSAMIDGVTRPFRDGPRRQEQARADQGIPRTWSTACPSRRTASAAPTKTPDYRLFLADADGSNAKQVKTGQRFHLMPSWSPDGAWVLFVAGEHYDCHPHVVKADGTGLKKLASRNGYRGVIDYLDVYDFHDGSSDLPVWAPDSKSVFYTAKVGSNVELFRVTLDGKSEQLTDTPAGSMHYHPAALARRQVAGLRLEARRRPAALRDAAERQEGAPHHRPQEGARRHVGVTGSRRQTSPDPWPGRGSFACRQSGSGRNQTLHLTAAACRLARLTCFSHGPMLSRNGAR